MPSHVNVTRYQNQEIDVATVLLTDRHVTSTIHLCVHMDQYNFIPYVNVTTTTIEIQNYYCSFMSSQLFQTLFFSEAFLICYYVVLITPSFPLVFEVHVTR